MLSCMLSAGTASTRTTAADTTAASTGRRCTTPAQRSAAGRRAGSAGRGRARSHRGGLIRDGLPSRVPVKPSSAGSSVSDPSTVIATVAAAATATPFISDWRSTSRPIIPITTVVPATSTDRPAVRIAMAVASSDVRPARRPSRNLVTMKSA